MGDHILHRLHRLLQQLELLLLQEDLVLLLIDCLLVLDFLEDVDLEGLLQLVLHAAQLVVELEERFLLAHDVDGLEAIRHLFLLLKGQLCCLLS